MQILSVERSEHCGGILLPDLESVKGTLQAFSEGKTKESSATRRELAMSGDTGGMIAAFLPLVQPSEGTFVGRLCTQMEQQLSYSDRFYRDFDYDGVGSFMKTSVTVRRLENGSFLLELNAAYVGNKVEEGLAEYLEAHRGLWWTKVELTLDANQGDRFVIDFASINDKLVGTGLGTLDASEIARLIAAGKSEEYSSFVADPGIVTLMADDQLSVTLGIDTITVGRYYEEPFTANGSVVTGARETRWSTLDGDTKQPKVYIYITSSNGEVRSFDRLPVLDEDIQMRMRELASDLEVRFNS